MKPNIFHPCPLFSSRNIDKFIKLKLEYNSWSTECLFGVIIFSIWKRWNLLFAWVRIMLTLLLNLEVDGQGTITHPILSLWVPFMSMDQRWNESAIYKVPDCAIIYHLLSLVKVHRWTACISCLERIMIMIYNVMFISYRMSSQPT